MIPNIRKKRRLAFRPKKSKSNVSKPDKRSTQEPNQPKAKSNSKDLTPSSEEQPKRRRVTRSSASVSRSSTDPARPTKTSSTAPARRKRSAASANKPSVDAKSEKQTKRRVSASSQSSADVQSEKSTVRGSNQDPGQERKQRRIREKTPRPEPRPKRAKLSQRNTADRKPTKEDTISTSTRKSEKTSPPRTRRQPASASKTQKVDKADIPRPARSRRKPVSTAEETSKDQKSIERKTTAQRKATTRSRKRPPTTKSPVQSAEDAETSPENLRFRDLDLHPRVYKGVKVKGHESPTPIQAKAIPVWLDGSDIVGSAQTGTGKTAAFALPILSQLESWRDEGLLREVDEEAEAEYRAQGRRGRPSRSKGRDRRGASRSAPRPSSSVARPMTLIIEPTRELANQVLDAIREYGAFTSCKTSVIYGGVGYGSQRAELANNPEIIVATPGRLLDYVEQGEISLKSVKAVILDEADRMLDMGFLPDVRRILEACPPPHKRQTGFFSATLPPAIQTLVNWAAKDPVTVSVDPPKSTARTVKHALYPVAEVQKSELLLALLEETHYESVIVFCRTRRGADRVGQLMKKKKHPVGVLHSDHNQKERELALKRFRSGEYDALVATDIASRGLDIADVTHVINYDVPENPEDYVHRIGRTGRAKASGDAFTLYTAQDAHSVLQIERYIEAKIDRRRVDGFDYRYTALFDEGKGNRPTLASGKFKSSRVRGGYVFGMSSRRRRR